MLSKLKQYYNGELAEMLGSVIEHAPDPIITIDEEHNIVMYNRAAETTFGYGVHDILGRPVSTLFPTENCTRTVHGSNDMATNPQCFEMVGYRRTGEGFPCEATVSVTNFKGKEYCTIVVRDITKRVIQEQENETYRSTKKKELRAQVKQLKDIKSTFG